MRIIYYMIETNGYLIPGKDTPENTNKYAKEIISPGISFRIYPVRL